MKILFIGNSFTYFNDMPQRIFPLFTDAAGIECEVYSVTKGGYTLGRFADPDDPYGKKVRELLDTVSFDAVILQEQSHTPISNNEGFCSALRLLDEMIEENGARTYLYSTWGYHEGKESLPLYGTDTRDMEMKLRAAYSAIAKEIGASVCQVGRAMTYAHEHSDTTLYRPDFYHPSFIGSVIAAAVIFATVFKDKKSAVLLPVHELSESEREDVAAAVLHALEEN